MIHIILIMQREANMLNGFLIRAVSVSIQV